MKSSGVAERTWSVGELAERFGLETHVLRYWEDVGLLAPARDGAGRRRYGSDDVVRVATILSSKVAGMSLEQILAGDVADLGGAEWMEIESVRDGNLDRAVVFHGRAFSPAGRQLPTANRGMRYFRLPWSCSTTPRAR